MPAKEVEMATVSVIIPTLNEAENIDLLLERILEVRRIGGIDFGIVFVDSASSDETCARVENWREKGPVSLLRLEKNFGLAGAVLAASRSVDSDIVLVLDADLSHPPEVIPLLLKPILAGEYDMMLGSRYVAGGSTPDWPWTRRLSSRIATLPARFFCDVCDPLAGFFAVRRQLLSELPVAVPGFKIALALLAEYGSTVRVAELPISFRDRDFGVSKMSSTVALAYLGQLTALFLRRIRRGSR